MEPRERFLNSSLNTSEDEIQQPFQKGKMTGLVNEYENVWQHARARKATGHRTADKIEEPPRNLSQS